MIADPDHENSKIYRYLEVTAIACNSKVNDSLHKSLYGDIGNFIFYEYFLSKPYIKNSSINKIKLFAPFLRRVIHSVNWIPKWDINNLPTELEDITFDVKNDKLLDTFKWNDKVEVDLGDSELGKDLIQKWNTTNDVPYYAPWDKVKDIPTPFNYRDIASQYANKMAHLSEDHKDSWIKIYALTGLHWFKLADNNFHVQYIAFPIATKHTFYGYLMLVFNKSHLDEYLKDSNSNFSLWIKDLGEFINKEIVSEYYLPILILFHNSMLEKQINKILNKAKDKGHFTKLNDRVRINSDFKRNSSIYIRILRKYKIDHYLVSCDNEMLELRLSNLWNQRLNYYKNFILPEEKRLHRKRSIDILLLSFVFCKYFVASPGLVKNVKAIVKFNLKPSKDYLQSALIFGGPGCGKDNMAEIIRVLGDEKYAWGEKHIINMATLKPQALAIPLLVGTQNVEPFVVKGLLNSAKSMYDTFIFDELNSLDIESQGSLLRVLENGEINSLGSLKKKKVKYLIIGIVNELPELLMKENINQKLEATKLILGEVITDILMNYIHTSKRFRSDLYYRMIRGGEIRILPLGSRPDDIPLLFYFFCDSEKEQKFMDHKNLILDIDLNVYDSLLKPNHQWHGNVRELQSIARLTVNEAGNPRADVLKIRIRHLEEAYNKYSQNLSTY